MSIFKQGQLVWAPKVAGVPANMPTNHVYEYDSWTYIENYEIEHKLKYNDKFFYTTLIKNLEEVDVCKQCGSDKIQFPMWVDNLQVVHDACEGLDPFCPNCNETLTRSFHCNLKEYLEAQEIIPLDENGNPMSLEELWGEKPIDWKNMSFEEWEQRCRADEDARFWHSEIYTHRCYENMKAGLQVKLPGNPIPSSKFYVEAK